MVQHHTAAPKWPPGGVGLRRVAGITRVTRAPLALGVLALALGAGAGATNPAATNPITSGTAAAGLTAPAPPQARERLASARRHATAAAAPARHADFGPARPAPVARRLADWIVASGDNHTAPFGLIDKQAAVLYLFDGGGRLRARTPVLLGLARGDTSVPGIGTRPLARIAAHERTTPAGRFAIEAGTNLHGEDLLWVDYDAAVSLHRVHSVNAGERRLQRLASPSAADNRISYGCINVPAAFYDRWLARDFAGSVALLYILPEQLRLDQVFALTAPAAPGAAGPTASARPTAAAAAAAADMHGTADPSDPAAAQPRSVGPNQPRSARGARRERAPEDDAPLPVPP